MNGWNQGRQKWERSFKVLDSYTQMIFHHREWKLASTKILITSFTTKDQLFPHQPHTNNHLLNDPKYTIYPNYPKYSIENLDPIFIRGMFKILIYLRLRELETKMSFSWISDIKNLNKSCFKEGSMGENALECVFSIVSLNHITRRRMK